jgi:hypothetical protein
VSEALQFCRENQRTTGSCVLRFRPAHARTCLAVCIHLLNHNNFRIAFSLNVRSSRRAVDFRKGPKCGSGCGWSRGAASSQLRGSVPRPHSKEALSPNVLGLFSVAQPDIIGQLTALARSTHKAAIVLYDMTVPITEFQSDGRSAFLTSSYSHNPSKARGCCAVVPRV